jgi:ribosomal 50S subunit-associated protein YjgA (DUF615 family)
MLEEINTLAIEVARANTYFHFFKQLRENYHDLAKAKDFWDYTLAAHMEMALLQLARVYDKCSKGLNLQYILKETKRKVLDNAKRQLLSKYEKECDKPDALVTKLREWRNNIIAHYNRSHALDRKHFWTLHPWEVSEVQELIDRAFEVLERCALMAGHQITFQKLAEGKDGYQVVLDCLRTRIPQPPRHASSHERRR